MPEKTDKKPATNISSRNGNRPDQILSDECDFAAPFQGVGGGRLGGGARLDFECASNALGREFTFADFPSLTPEDLQILGEQCDFTDSTGGRDGGAAPFQGFGDDQNFQMDPECVASVLGTAFGSGVNVTAEQLQELFAECGS